MRSFIAALAIGTALVSPAHAGPAQDYTDLREEIWQATLDSSPQLATSVGDRRGDGKLGDLSLEEYDRQVAENRAFLARLNAIDESALPEDLRIDYAILKRSFEDNIEGAAFDQNRYVIFTNRGGWFTWFASLPYRSPLFTAADYESYVSRLEAFAAVNADGIARSREAVTRGLTQPCGPMEGLEDRIS